MKTLNSDLRLACNLSSIPCANKRLPGFGLPICKNPRFKSGDSSIGEWGPHWVRFYNSSYRLAAIQAESPSPNPASNRKPLAEPVFRFKLRPFLLHVQACFDSPTHPWNPN